jgi:hypothetical protein
MNFLSISTGPRQFQASDPPDARTLAVTLAHLGWPGDEPPLPATGWLSFIESASSCNRLVAKASFAVMHRTTHFCCAVLAKPLGAAA